MSLVKTNELPASGTPEGPLSADAHITPRRIVDALDRYIVGQQDAKRAVAIALRSRWRRQQLDDTMRQEVTPKNILMVGPTGVGKTEIARRVAKIIDAPFVKVEATKFTEVGYVGRDVESIVRDLLEVSIAMLHGERMAEVRDQAASAAVQRLADILVEQRAGQRSARGREEVAATAEGEERADGETRKRQAAIRRRLARQRSQVIELLNNDAIEDETVDLELDNEVDVSTVELETGSGIEELQEAFNDLIDGLAPRRRHRKVSVREARRILTQQEANRLVDFDSLVEAAVRRAEDSGIIFVDEIDKTITPNGEYGPDVSGEGVQRDLLPIVEGSVVMTRYGPVKTDHMLFIAAGSFQSVRPSDLIPELQGRLPIRVELDSLSEDDLFAILTEPDNALTRQYAALLRADGVDVEFAEDGLREMAHLAAQVNSHTEDIGARRLHTIVERVLEDLSFEAPERQGERVRVDAEYVRSRIQDVAADDDLSKFIL
ncbi:MAG TPA: ATP-dependent protease ATPase subunit HslU [Thermomicrobiaceae bacterium]|nr:ATP-dependent protease ATPase subunit HslU [Thermomicrobiaceae bacterium]